MTPSTRLARWRQQLPLIETDHPALAESVGRAPDDLAVLRIFDPDYPERFVVAAGAPWFMTLFGRDSLITAWMALLLSPEAAVGVLQTLARFQGEKVDPWSEEQPGRILHEMRFAASTSFSLGGGSVYYGSADSTPLFVMLLGELARFGASTSFLAELLPHADRALAWITDYGDADGDGYVEYQRLTPHGLENQGWKDSPAAIRFADGRYAETPIAVCEVQAYVYGAYRARADLARATGGDPAPWDARAVELQAAFDRDFWLPDRGWYALGLDAAKQPIDALASNMGHALWTGLALPERAAEVAERLTEPALFSGWGVRTLASTMTAFNPLSYHNGSVWPHDNALCVAGLARGGFVNETRRVTGGLLDAAVAQNGLLPELFAGLSRDDVPTPVSYPTSCSPQAWAAAAPLLLVRSLLGLQPHAPSRRLTLRPIMLDGMRRLSVAGIPIAGHRVAISIDRGRLDVSGLPPDWDLDAP